MNRRFEFQSISYNAFLKNERISFKEDDKCLQVGLFNETCGHVVYVSCRTLDTPAMLKRCLPILKLVSSSFRLIKNQNLQYRLNSGIYGNEESGKVLSIFPKDQKEFEQLLTDVISFTKDLKGPIVSNAQRVSNVVYIQRADKFGNEFRLTLPKLAELPIQIPEKYRQKKKGNVILGSFYLPFQTLRTSAKGNIFKGINLRRFAFSWCLIKQGNPVAFDDHFDRDMKDRLLWQKEIVNSLQDHICTPRYIDYFEQGGSSYLVLGYAEGESLGHHVREILTGRTWVRLKTADKEKLLRWYLQAVTLTNSIHQREVVHRDVTDSNFIILEDGRLCIIDFELSFSLSEERPYPPFLLGTLGYASPEQLHYHYPDFKDDIYSLGALLCYVMTGCQPREFLDSSLTVVCAKLTRLTGSRLLAELSCKCLSATRKNRPAIQLIQNTVNQYLQTLNHHKDETLAMAV